MADRLQELLQQRALIKEHLAWIEAEIAAASGRSPAIPPLEPALAPNTPGSSSSAPTATHPLAGQRPVTPVTVPAIAGEADADALLATLIAAERRTPPPDKKGCWMIFLTALFLVVGITVGLLYFFRR